MVSPPSSDSSEDDGANYENTYRLLDVRSAEDCDDSSSVTRSYYCNRNLSIQTLCNPTAAGRRFIECPRMRANSCNYFEWLDPEFPSRAKEVIWELYEQNNELLDFTAQLSIDLADTMDELDRIKEDFLEAKGFAEFLSQSDDRERKELEMSLTVNKRLRKCLTCYIRFTVAIVGLISVLACTFK